jgi:hypothetical protein
MKAPTNRNGTSPIAKDRKDGLGVSVGVVEVGQGVRVGMVIGVIVGVNVGIGVDVGKGVLLGSGVFVSGSAVGSRVGIGVADWHATSKVMVKHTANIKRIFMIAPLL